MAAVKSLYQETIDSKSIQIQKTKKEFDGDFTVVVFPLLKISKKTAEETANELGNYIQKNLPFIQSYNVIKGFLNIEISNVYWIKFLNEIYDDENFGIVTENSK